MTTGLTKIKSSTGATASVDGAYAGNFQGFINRLENSGYSVNVLGGYNYRTIAGTDTLSNHAFGRAIDMNPSSDMKVFGGRSGDHGFPPKVSEMAKEYGLSWGGNWNNPDTMHFEVAKGASPISLDDSLVTNARGAYSIPYDNFSGSDVSNNTQLASFNVEDGPSYQPQGNELTKGNTWSDGTPADGALPKADAPGEGEGPLVVDVKKRPDGSSENASEDTGDYIDGKYVSKPKAGSQGQATSVPQAIVSAGNQQATAAANAAKSTSEAALKAATTTTKSDATLQSQQQSYASNWAVRIFLFIVGAIFIGGALLLFAGQTIMQEKSPA